MIYLIFDINHKILKYSVDGERDSKNQGGVFPVFQFKWKRSEAYRPFFHVIQFMFLPRGSIKKNTIQKLVVKENHLLLSFICLMGFQDVKLRFHQRPMFYNEKFTKFCYVQLKIKQFSQKRKDRKHNLKNI